VIRPGTSQTLGANWDGAGVNFALYSESASAVELCLFDGAGETEGRFFLPACDEGVWHGYLPGCKPGQQYGYRVQGNYDPAAGLRFNSNKLLIDPYAKQLSGQLTWSKAVFGFDTDDGHKDDQVPSTLDSAAFVPKAVVQGSGEQVPRPAPPIPWQDTIIYEVNVRGYTMLHPAVPAADRGRFRGLSNAHLLDYLKALGITSIELMPVHAFVDEDFLTERGLHNYWGYNSLSFFAPETRYLSGTDIDEFRSMVNAIHDAGLEVILDVVYNHTAEGDRLGPTLSFRGIDNLTYYRTPADSPGDYVNDTACGNTLNIDHPRVQALVCDSLCYWSRDMGVDGFRFDLCSILGRTTNGFDPQHAFFERIGNEPMLRDVKLIAEPWDLGPGGYQLGNFPSRWSEWNDQYRDAVRRFWRGDDSQTSEFARRLHGSADIFEQRGRSPRASVNYITSHDGLTLLDLVCYEQRHNENNGEDNRDGHHHNFGCNYGVEGVTSDEKINQLRRRQRLNMLASLLLSQGTPMLLGGDEFGNSQHGNNNAYAQDNEIGWIDWSGLELDPDFQVAVRQLIWLRRNNDLLKRDVYRHGLGKNSAGHPDIEWLTPDGGHLSEQQWLHDRALILLLTETNEDPGADDHPLAVAILINAALGSVDFRLPKIVAHGEWLCAFSSDNVEHVGTDIRRLTDRSCACFLYRKV